MANKEDLDPFEFIRTIAVARLMMPKSYVRLSAGREEINEQMLMDHPSAALIHSKVSLGQTHSLSRPL